MGLLLLMNASLPLLTFTSMNGLVYATIAALSVVINDFTWSDLILVVISFIINWPLDFFGFSAIGVFINLTPELFDDFGQASYTFGKLLMYCATGLMMTYQIVQTIVNDELTLA